MTTDFKTDALEKSLQTLREAWTAYQNNKNDDLTSIIADSCIQRYEYTLETAWKLMKKIRQLDKLVDELAKGKPMEKILR